MSINDTGCASATASASSSTLSASFCALSMSRIKKPPSSLLHQPFASFASFLAAFICSLVSSLSNVTRCIDSFLPRLVVYSLGVILNDLTPFSWSDESFSVSIFTAPIGVSTDSFQFASLISTVGATVALAFIASVIATTSSSVKALSKL